MELQAFCSSCKVLNIIKCTEVRSRVSVSQVCLQLDLFVKPMQPSLLRFTEGRNIQ